MEENNEDVPTIYIFDNYGGRARDVAAVAMAEDGQYLAGHLCSHRSFMPHDMGVTSDWKHEYYDKKYPDGWELEVLPVGDPMIEELGKLNQERANEES